MTMCKKIPYKNKPGDGLMITTVRARTHARAHEHTHTYTWRETRTKKKKMEKKAWFVSVDRVADNYWEVLDLNRLCGKCLHKKKKKRGIKEKHYRKRNLLFSRGVLIVIKWIFVHQPGTWPLFLRFLFISGCIWRITKAFGRILNFNTKKISHEIWKYEIFV